MSIALVTAAWYALVSGGTFAAYGYDKRQARRGRRRVPERTLHGLELLGGWPGALAGQRAFHHKWRKRRFMTVFRLIVAAHLAAWALTVYLLR